MSLVTNAVRRDTMSHPFLVGLKPAHLELLASCAMPAHFEAGETIFQEGDIANRFYLIQNGGVALECGIGSERVCIETLAAGDVVGWSWIFEPYTWHFDAVTFATTDAIFFYGTRLREMCECDHELGYELLKRISMVMIDRLQSTRRQVVKSMLLLKRPRSSL